MSNLAAQFVVALALAARGASAVTCAVDTMNGADYTAKTGVDDMYCVMDAVSCKTDPTCCTAPTPTKTCHSEGSAITCDADQFNRLTLSGVGSDATANKAQCCMTKATCATATCSAHMQKDTAKSDDVKCSRDATSCDTSCCQPKNGTCYALGVAGNSCDAGSSLLAAHMATTGSDKAACCTADVKCSTHNCPSATHELKVNAATLKCAQGTCDDSQCCQCKSTTCCGATVNCGTNMYKDSAKNGVTFQDKATDCCTAQAQCKDSDTVPVDGTSVSGAPVLSSFWPLFLTFSMLGLLLRN